MCGQLIVNDMGRFKFVKLLNNAWIIIGLPVTVIGYLSYQMYISFKMGWFIAKHFK